MRRETKRGGLTLLELLIVIVVIGILSAMMLFSSREAISTAKANNIIANLRNLKMAALAWYADSFDQIPNINVGAIKWNKYRSNDDKDYWSCIKRYISNSSHQELYTYYSLVTSSQLDSSGNTDNKEQSAWFVVYANKDLDDKIKRKLKGRAKSTNLYRRKL